MFIDTFIKDPYECLRHNHTAGGSNQSSLRYPPRNSEIARPKFKLLPTPELVLVVEETVTTVLERESTV